MLGGLNNICLKKFIISLTFTITGKMYIAM